MLHKQINVSAWFSTGDSRASIGRKSEDTGSVSDKEKDDVDLHHVKSSIVFSRSQMRVRDSTLYNTRAVFELRCAMYSVCVCVLLLELSSMIPRAVTSQG